MEIHGKQIIVNYRSMPGEGRSYESIPKKIRAG